MTAEIHASVAGGFAPHPYFSDTLNRNIVKSEVEGGVYLASLAPGAAVEIRTRNHTYTLVHCGDDTAELSGHPTFCPQPVRVRIYGSTWGGTMLRQGYIGRSMHLEFGHPDYVSPITTSRIMEIREMEK